MNNEYEIRNAIIESATITKEDYGILTAWIQLEYGSSSHQGFGGYALYQPSVAKNYKFRSNAGHFIWRVMEVVGVDRWDNLKGKTVRVKFSLNGIKSIGHIINDNWFTPSEEFKVQEEI